MISLNNWFVTLSLSTLQGRIKSNLKKSPENPKVPFWQARCAGLKIGLIFIFGCRPSLIGTVFQHWLYWEANSMSHLNKLLRQLKSVIGNFFCLIMKSQKWVFWGLLKRAAQTRTSDPLHGKQILYHYATGARH